MLVYQFRQIEQWPGKRSTYRQSSKFNTPHSKTLDLLERELSHLAAKQIVIQADCELSEIRNDGMLRSNARLRGPGIILSFNSKHGALSYPCDKFTRWEDNLRAIALSLEALRTVDRYGVTRSAEQYKGWAKLPGPTQPSVGPQEAAAVLVRFATAFTAGDILASPETYREAYKSAAATTHPDRNGGSDGSFKVIQRAAEILNRHHGL